MRIALGGVSLTVLLLFYLGVYRPTRSSFSGWWSVGLLCACVATSLLLFNGSDLQPILNPASNVLSIAGAMCIWFAMRSLRRRHLPLWLLGVAPPVILVPSLLENPADNIWAGNGYLFIFMGVLFGAGSAEVWLAWAARRERPNEEPHPDVVVALLVSAIASSALAAFYLLRSVIFLVAGPESNAFETVAGTAPTTGILLVSLVAVTFSVSAVSWDQQMQGLRRRALHDDLTGLLGRTEFRAQAERLIDGERASDGSATLVAADLDHFKALNDAQGHAAGDRALVAFAAALQDSLGPGEIAGRLGGEEFAMVLLDADSAGVIARLEAIRDGVAARSHGFDFDMPTVSWGVAGLDDGDTVSELFERADMAMYRAKEDGRDRVVKYTPDIGQQVGRALRRRSTDRDGTEH